jgi:hypothetical protein
LNEKVVDLLEFGYPDLIVSDAVVIGHGFESSPYPFHLGAILISNDPVAVDMAAARILNYQPEEVAHLVEARDRGYGSLDFGDIEISGDVSIEELSAKTRDIESAFQDLQKLKTPIKFYEGVNPKTGNLCYGGCICSIKGALGTAEKKYPGNIAGAKPGGIVMGYYKGDVIHPGQPVAFIGSCSGVEGKLECGKLIRIKNCPVKVRDLAVLLLHKFDIKSPAFDPANIAKMLYYSGIEAWSWKYLGKREQGNKGARRGAMELKKVLAGWNKVCPGCNIARKYPDSFIGKKVRNHWEKGCPSHDAYVEVYGADEPSPKNKRRKGPGEKRKGKVQGVKGKTAAKGTNQTAKAQRTRR